jgi:protein-arginine kinase activator protein McsA
MDIYLLLFLIIVLAGSVSVYLFYLKEKKEELDAVRRGVCPKCKHNTISITDSRSHGCSGTQTIHIVCETCGYENSFTIHGGGCGGGSCGV